MSDDEVTPTYFYFEEGCDCWAVVGNIAGLQAALKMYVDELEDGDDYDFRVKRHDMTEAEIEALPEI